MKHEPTPKNNQELRELAQEALENWTLDSETDPDGHIKAGLEYYVSDGDVAGLFEGYDQYLEKWDILEEMARRIGSQR